MFERLRRWIGGACAAAAVAGTALAAEPPPRRVVSINLCADELLLALADPGQIAALSPFATDPTLSYLPDAAERFRHDAADAETVIAIDPDLVLAGRFTRRATRDLLADLGYRVEVLEPARSIAGSIAQIRRIAAILGHPERGAALVRAIEAARSRAAAAAAAEPTSAAVYQRRGYVSGAETLIGDLLATVGFVDGAGRLAGATGGLVPLERLVAAPPDVLVLAAEAPAAEDQGSALLAHPALARRFPPERRIVLPPALTVCGGPSLPEAIDRLAAEARRFAAGG